MENSRKQQQSKLRLQATNKKNTQRAFLSKKK